VEHEEEEPIHHCSKLLHRNKLYVESLAKELRKFVGPSACGEHLLTTQLGQ